MLLCKAAFIPLFNFYWPGMYYVQSPCHESLPACQCSGTNAGRSICFTHWNTWTSRVRLFLLWIFDWIYHVDVQDTYVTTVTVLTSEPGVCTDVKDLMNVVKIAMHQVEAPVNIQILCWYIHIKHDLPLNDRAKSYLHSHTQKGTSSCGSQLDHSCHIQWSICRAQPVTAPLLL